MIFEYEIQQEKYNLENIIYRKSRTEILVRYMYIIFYYIIIKKYKPLKYYLIFYNFVFYIFVAYLIYFEYF